MNKSRFNRAKTSISYFSNAFLILGVVNLSEIKIKKNILKYNFKILLILLYCFHVTVRQFYYYIFTMYVSIKAICHELFEHDKYSLVITCAHHAGEFMYYVGTTIQLVLYWYKAKDIKRYLQEWHYFEYDYYRRTGIELKNLSIIKIKIITILSTLIALSVSAMYTKFFGEFDFVSLFIRHDDLLKMYTNVFWYILCTNVKNSGKQLREDFIAYLKRNPCMNDLEQYALLWIKLVNLTNLIGKIFGKIYLFNIISDLSILIANVYATCLITAKHSQKDTITGFWGETYHYNFAFYDPLIFVLSVYFYFAYAFIRQWLCITTAHDAHKEVSNIFII